VNGVGRPVRVLGGHVRGTAARDGTRIAWSAAGSGAPTLVMVPGWLSHLGDDGSDDAGWFHSRLAERVRLVRYDRPGNGLADRVAHDFSLDGQVDSLARVVHAAGERRVALFAEGMGAPAAIAYTAAHPDRVAHLVLFNGTPCLAATPDYPDGADPLLLTAVEQLIRADWTVAALTMGHLLAPGTTGDALDRLATQWCGAAGSSAAAALVRETMAIDVRHLLSRVNTPTLLLHRRDNPFVSVNNAFRLAESIKGAELRLLEGGAHLPWHGNRAAVVRLVADFVGRTRLPLTARENEIMRAVAEGLSNGQIAQVLGISAQTVARHLSNVFLKLNVGSRVAALAELRSMVVDGWSGEDIAEYATIAVPGRPTRDEPRRVGLPAV
jgi:pimeloyl-ACP methyl ester carboxylesterase/DNA-binding CsgD family transcriptional regulator